MPSLTKQSAKAVGESPFEPEDYAFTAKLLRNYCNDDRRSFYGVCSNNLNIILAALDAVSEDLAPMTETNSVMAESARNVAYLVALTSVATAARRYHAIVTARPGVTPEQIEAWAELGKAIAGLEEVEGER